MSTTENPIREYEAGHIGQDSQTEEINSFMEPANVEASDQPEPEPELTFEQRCAQLERAITRHPLMREIMYKMLDYCQVETELDALEVEVTAYPEYAACQQSVVAMANILIKHFGLRCIEHAADGSVVSEADKEGLDEDQIDDLVAYLSYETTLEGAHYVEQNRPEARLITLFNLNPQRSETYVELLEFLEQAPRSYREIKTMMKGKPALETIIGGRTQTMQPSVFVDQLERAGAIVWNGGWILSSAGTSLLNEMRKA